MKTLKFVFLMAVFMMVLVVTVTSSQANTTKENPTTASIQASNGGAEYCWMVSSNNETMTANTEGLQSKKEIDLVNGEMANIATIETAKAEVSEAKGNSKDLLMYGLAKKSNEEVIANTNLSGQKMYAENQKSKDLVAIMSVGGAEVKVIVASNNTLIDMPVQATI
ncbi:MAG: hypothetical protein WCW04_02595 [Candidatus Paceibacterota bacterium]